MPALRKSIITSVQATSPYTLAAKRLAASLNKPLEGKSFFQLSTAVVWSDLLTSFVHDVNAAAALWQQT